MEDKESLISWTCLSIFRDIKYLPLEVNFLIENKIEKRITPKDFWERLYYRMKNIISCTAGEDCILCASNPNCIVGKIFFPVNKENRRSLLPRLRVIDVHQRKKNLSSSIILFGECYKYLSYLYAAMTSIDRNLRLLRITIHKEFSEKTVTLLDSYKIVLSGENLIESLDLFIERKMKSINSRDEITITTKTPILVRAQLDNNPYNIIYYIIRNSLGKLFLLVNERSKNKLMKSLINKESITNGVKVSGSNISVSKKRFKSIRTGKSIFFSSISTKLSLMFKNQVKEILIPILLSSQVTGIGRLSSWGYGNIKII
ncbi:MAG: hypothetical protein ABGF52_09685 [Candidatus Asgardarchaeum sp.]